MRIETGDRQAAELARVWWLFLLVGGASAIGGAILLAKPGDSLATLAVIVGIFLLLDGIVELALAFAHSRENRGLAVLLGVLGIIAGLLLIRHPTHAVTAIGLLIGIWLVAAGLVRLMRVLTGGTHVMLGMAIALLEIGVGVVVIANPHIGYGTLAVLVGLWLIVNGIATIVLGLAFRKGGTALAGASRPTRRSLTAAGRPNQPARRS